MKFSTKKLIGVVMANGIALTKPGTKQSRPSLDDQPQSKMTAVELEAGGWLLVKDEAVLGLIFSDKE